MERGREQKMDKIDAWKRGEKKKKRIEVKEKRIRIKGSRREMGKGTRRRRLRWSDMLESKE